MSDYAVQRDDHLKHVTVHETPPELEPVIETSDVYDELSEMQSDDQLDWITGEYDREGLEAVDEALKDLEETGDTEWTLSLETTPVGIDEIGAKLKAEVTAEYELQVVGYGTATAEAQVTYIYDGDNRDIEAIGDLNGEMDLDLPDHVTEEEKQAALRNVEEDIVLAGEQLTEVINQA